MVGCNVTILDPSYYWPSKFAILMDTSVIQFSSCFKALGFVFWLVFIFLIITERSGDVGSQQVKRNFLSMCILYTCM
jgi:hypothetical protein